MTDKLRAATRNCIYLGLDPAALVKRYAEEHFRESIPSHCPAPDALDGIEANINRFLRERPDLK